jgi:hypothetical protein
MATNVANGRRAQPSTPIGVKLRADAQRLDLQLACACFSLAWARKNAAHAADIGIAALFIVGIAEPVSNQDRFVACLAGMVMFRGGGRLDCRRCNQRRAESCNKSLSHVDLHDGGRRCARCILFKGVSLGVSARWLNSVGCAEKAD